MANCSAWTYALRKMPVRASQCEPVVAEAAMARRFDYPAAVIHSMGSEMLFKTADNRNYSWYKIEEGNYRVQMGYVDLTRTCKTSTASKHSDFELTGDRDGIFQGNYTGLRHYHVWNERCQQHSHRVISLIIRTIQCTTADALLSGHII